MAWQLLDLAESRNPFSSKGYSVVVMLFVPDTVMKPSRNPFSSKGYSVSIDAD